MTTAAINASAAKDDRCFYGIDVVVDERQLDFVMYELNTDLSRSRHVTSYNVLELFYCTCTHNIQHGNRLKTYSYNTVWSELCECIRANSLQSPDSVVTDLFHD